MKQLKSSNFFIEDVVCLKDDENKVGVVTLTTLDEEDIEEEDEESFPLQPKHVRVSFMDENIDSRDIPENKLVCLDRNLKLSDIARYPVEMGNKQQTGTVINVRVVADLQATYTGNSEVTILKDIDTTKLKNYYDIEEGTCVLMNNWFGVVRRVYDDIYVKFSDDSVCKLPVSKVKVEDRYKDSSRFSMERVYSGVKVQALRSDTFKHAQWIKGHYKPSNTTGHVIMTEISKVYVEWQYQNLKVDTKKNDAPPLFSIKNISSLTVLRSLHEQQAMGLGELVQFKNPEEPKGYGVETFDNLINPCFKIIKTKSYVDIQWQDSTITKDIKSTDLLICYNIDEQDFWPTDYVYLKEEYSRKKNFDGVKVGVVKSVNALERVCEVVWLESTEKDNLNAEPKEQSTYEISSHPLYTQRIGERVIITNDLYPIDRQCKGISKEEAKQDWVGEIVSINDPEHLGRIGVCCSPSKNVHYVFPFQIFILSDNEDSMHDGFISTSDMSDVVVVDLDDEDESEEELDRLKEKDYDYDDDEDDYGHHHQRFSKEEIDNAMEVDDEEWEADDSEWETEEEIDEEDLISIDENQGPEIVEIHSEDEMINDPEFNEKMKEELEKVTHTPVSVEEKDAQTKRTFILLEDPPENHYFLGQDHSVLSKSFYKTIMKEHKLLSSELPEGEIVVAAFSSHLELLRAIIFGPKDTIYEGAVFMFDICIPGDYPHSPPLVHYYSLTVGMGKLNPNLYEDGKVCLSLLGTWHGKEETEEWTPNSNILQVLLSIQGLVLGVQLPYFNEAGYDKLMQNSEENFTANYYNERAFYLSVHTINQTLNMLNLSNESIFEIFREDILDYYYDGKHMLQYINNKCQDIIKNSEKNKDGALNVKMEKLETVSKGCLILLKNEVNYLQSKLEK